MMARSNRSKARPDTLMQDQKQSVETPCDTRPDHTSGQWSSSISRPGRQLRGDFRHIDEDRRRSKIGIGGSLAAPPLPHHRAYGSVHGGSIRLSFGGQDTDEEGRASRRTRWAAPCCTVTWRAMRQSPDRDPAATAAWNWDTPLRRSSLKRLRPFFHCRQIYMRNRRRIQASRL